MRLRTRSPVVMSRQRNCGRVTGRLYGIPIALEDNIDTAGVIFLGKPNLDEMAFEGTGRTSCFGPVHNPWNTDRITGGSAAGSAAAVSKP